MFIVGVYARHVYCGSHTTANRSAHNSKQNKLVRSVEQTRQISVSNTDYGFLFTILRLLCSSNADGTDL